MQQDISTETGVCRLAEEGVQKGNFTAAEQLLCGHMQQHYGGLHDLIQQEHELYRFRGRAEYNQMMEKFATYLRERTTRAKREATRPDLTGKVFYFAGRAVDAMVHAMLLADDPAEGWYSHSMPDVVISRARDAVIYHLLAQMLEVKKRKAIYEKRELIHKIETLEEMMAIVQAIREEGIATFDEARNAFENALFVSKSRCYALQKYVTIHASTLLRTKFVHTSEQEAYLEVFRGTASLREGTVIYPNTANRDVITNLEGAQAFRTMLQHHLFVYEEKGAANDPLGSILTHMGALPTDETFRKFIWVHIARTINAYEVSRGEKERNKVLEQWLGFKAIVKSNLGLSQPKGPLDYLHTAPPS